MVRPVGEQKQRLHHFDLRAGQLVHELVQPVVGHHLGIVVEQHHHLARRRSDPPVTHRGEVERAGERHHHGIRVIGQLVDQLPGSPLGRFVVDDHDFHVRIPGAVVQAG